MDNDNIIGNGKESNLEPVRKNFSNATEKVADKKDVLTSLNSLADNPSYSEIVNPKDENADDSKQTFPCEPSSSYLSMSDDIFINMEKDDTLKIDPGSNLEPSVDRFSKETAQIPDDKDVMAIKNDFSENDSTSNNCKVSEPKQYTGDTKQIINCEFSTSSLSPATHIVIKEEPDSSLAPISQNEDSSEEDAESIRQSILNLIDDIFHAFMCKNGSSCKQENCAKMKQAILHAKTCKNQFSNALCVPCHHFKMILVYHAHICREPELSIRCKLLRCPQFKTYIQKMKLNQQETDASLISQPPHSDDSSSSMELKISNVRSLSDSSTFSSDGTLLIIKSEADTTDTDIK